MTDFLLLEQIHRMILGISKPRLMFKKGICLKGFFRPYMSFGDYTEAEIFKNINEVTPVYARFSSMLGDWGTADTTRNIKGLSVKFLGRDGNYDLISQNLPVYFINKPEKFPQMWEAFTVKNSFDKINSRRFWKFVTDNPESVNCAIRLFSCEGISGSYIYEKWYSVNTCVWENETGDRFLVRYKWEPAVEDQGYFEEKSKKANRTFAEFMAGFDPDRGIDELQGFLDDGKFPAFELQVQMVNYKYISHPNYLKQTLYWNEAISSPVAVGIMKLTEMQQDVEKQSLCFVPGNTVKGIELCNDGFSMIMNHAHKMGAAERGEKM